MKQDDTKQKFKKKGKIMAVGKESLNRVAKSMQHKPSGIAFEEKEKEGIGNTELMEPIKETIEEIERKEIEDREELVKLIDDAIKNKKQNIEANRSKESVKNTKTSNTTKVKKQPDTLRNNELESKNNHVNKDSTIIMRTKIVAIGDEMPNCFL